MDELLALVGVVTLLAAVGVSALAQERHRAFATRAAVVTAAPTVDLEEAFRVDPARIWILPSETAPEPVSPEPVVDGPHELSLLLAKRFDLDPALAGAIANTAVFHFESPLVNALTPAKHLHTSREGTR